MVPNMDIYSKAYQWTVSVLIKQHDNDHPFTPCPEMETEILEAQKSLDHPAGAITDMDHNTIKHACDIVFDSIVSKIIDEDPKAQEAFDDALCHQIVVTCQCLHIYLQLADRLMDTYNQSISSPKGQGSTVA
ncbi:hypothetical protein BYT27DRAFT_7258268 [Phlegmacium glaucopus]|nr:hypothetical protein BYT27DRAFT_7258268 [Phlegmacium glaucopus]